MQLGAQSSGGMTKVELSPNTLSRLNALFAGSERTDAERLLVDRCSKNLPFCEDSDAGSLERIRFAALKISNGDLSALRSAVDLANIDWRDLLVAAGFSEDVHAHEWWFPSGNSA